MIIQTEKLTEMRERGMSARDISKATGLTRNAVIGRIWRANNPEWTKIYDSLRPERGYK